MSKKLHHFLSIAFVLCFYLTGFAQPANDLCENATAIGTSIDLDFSTVDAETDGPEHANDCVSSGSTGTVTWNDVWYRFTPDFTGTAEFSTCGTADFDTKIFVYGPGAPCPPTDDDVLACNEDGSGCAGFTSYTTFSVEEGMEYLLRIGGWGNGAPGEEGTGTFTIAEFIPPGGPENDECADAIAVGSGTHDFSSVGATSGLPYHPGECTGGTADSLYNDIWYLYTADFTGTAVFSTCGTANFDTNIAAYAPGAPCPPDASDLIACSEDVSDCSGFTSEFLFDVVEGEDYLLRIGGWGSSSPGEEGSGTFRIEEFTPPNDNCVDAIAIDGEALGMAFTTINANTDGPDHANDCVSSGSTGEVLWNDIWYTYTPDFTGTAEFSTCSTADFDTKIFVYGPDAPCPPTDDDVLACNEDGGGCDNFTSYVQFEVEEGMTYLLRLGGWGNGEPGEEGSGTFIVRRFNPTAAPENDNCVDAIAIGSVSGEAFSTINATTDGPEHANDCVSSGSTGNITYNDIWYEYTPEFTGTAEFSTCSTADFDTKIIVYGPGFSCPPTDDQLIACNEDGGGCEGFTSSTTFEVVAGETYLLRLGGWGDGPPGEQGSGFFDAREFDPTPPPPNDNCGDAIVLDLGDMDSTTVEFTTTGANTSPPFYTETVACFDVPNGETASFQDIWYTWTATFNGYLEWSNCGTASFDSRMEVYGPNESCPPTPDAIIDCSDDGVDEAGNSCGGFTSRVIFPVEEGSSYLFRLGGFNQNSFGTGTFVAKRVPPPIVPPNDNCVDADTAYIITVEEADNFDVIFPGFTNNGSVEGPTPSCQSSGEFWDVYYKFNSENFTDIELRFNRVSNTHFYIDLFQDCINLPVDGPDICLDTDGQAEFFSLSLPGFPGTPTEYIMRVSTRVTSDPAGEFWFQLVEGTMSDLEEIGFNNFNFYPNPVMGNANVVFEIQESTSAQFQVLNTLGQVLSAENLGTLTSGKHNMEIALNNLDPGIYFFRLQMEEGEKTVKFIKE